MKESRSSKDWQRRQAKDLFVKQAKKDNYRARSAYKLEELDHHYHLLNKAKTVIELGSSPGAWTQYILRRTEKLRQKPIIVAVDLLTMAAPSEVTFIQGDFKDKCIQTQIKASLQNQPATLILSDMAPNMSGLRSVDDARAINLCEEVVGFADGCLYSGGHLVCKAFHGCYFEDFLHDLKTRFDKTRCFKPLSSRARSREVYVVALGKK